MNISEVSTAQFVGELEFNLGSSQRLLNVKWADNVDIQDNAGRVYLIVSDGEIMKIGGSQSKGGIKSTFAFYISANQGRPSIRSYGIMSLIADQLKLGKDVTIHMITSEQIAAPVKGLFSQSMCKVSAFKEMEHKCIEDYKAIVGDYPAWNFQEKGEAWSAEIQQQHANMLK